MNQVPRAAHGINMKLVSVLKSSLSVVWCRHQNDGKHLYFRFKKITITPYAIHHRVVELFFSLSSLASSHIFLNKQKLFTTEKYQAIDWLYAIKILSLGGIKPQVSILFLSLNLFFSEWLKLAIPKVIRKDDWWILMRKIIFVVDLVFDSSKNVRTFVIIRAELHKSSRTFVCVCVCAKKKICA